MKQLVLDAGPLIALFYAKDTYHRESVAGFTQLSQAKTILLTPIPIIFEVYKWLMQRTSPDVAQQALKTLEKSLHLIAVDQAEFGDLTTMIYTLSQWQGTLEDATVAVIALRYQCPAWTLNFRDFSIFSKLEFWNPD